MQRALMVLLSLMLAASPLAAQEDDASTIFEPDVPATEEAVEEDAPEVSIAVHDGTEAAATATQIEHAVGRAATLVGPTGLFHLISADSTASVERNAGKAKVRTTTKKTGTRQREQSGFMFAS